MKICVIGLGYIGLPTAAMFAMHGAEVLGVDVCPQVVEEVNRGTPHIVEPNLAHVVQSAVARGMLRASLTPEPADVFLIAVPTPFKGEQHEPDLRYIHAAAESIAPMLRRGNCVMLESTVPVGATESLRDRLQELRDDLQLAREDAEACDVHVAYCPERVLPGKIMHELVENDRIVGGINAASAQRAAEIYRIFVRGNVLTTNARTAEMVKLTENAFRDVNIAFANELSLICDRLHIDVWECIRLANRHPRVNILQPGPGVGGHCIAVDPWFIVSRTPELARLIAAAREVNDAKPQFVISKVHEVVDALVASGKKRREDVFIACLGLAFKPDIDDLRQSPALEITRKLAQEYPGQVLAVEPNIRALPQELEELGVRLAAPKVVQTADVVVLLVAHREFRDIGLPADNAQAVIDTVGMWKS
jgi:UDP-N-acetyl-D-mannosaminuronic acid dehydrogenase